MELQVLRFTIAGLLSLAAAVAIGGCAGGAGWISHAGDCWGQGLASGAGCAESVSVRAAAVGVGTSRRTGLLDPPDCGAPVDCDAVAAVVTSGGGADHSGGVAPTGETTQGMEDADLTPDPRTGGDSAEAPTPGTATGVSDGATTNQVAILTPTESSTGVASCADIDVGSVGKRGMPYSGAELTCFREVALSLEPVEVRDFTDIQVAVIGLYNTRDPKWQQGVERALAFSELQNTPQINFAGIKPAYDQGRYGIVVNRANVVWSNLDKGYRLTQKDRTFVAEFACRAGVQLHMQGTVSDDHERWCRIWLERLEHEGGDTSEARTLLDQVE